MQVSQKHRGSVVDMEGSCFDSSSFHVTTHHVLASVERQKVLIEFSSSTIEITASAFKGFRQKSEMNEITTTNSYYSSTASS